MSGDNLPPRYSVVDTRRRWSEEEKQAILAETFQPRANVSAIARRHGLKPSLLFRWRRLAMEKGQSQPTEPSFLPVSVAPAMEPPAPSSDSRIEIALESGHRVRVGSGVDVDALKRILDVLERR